MDYGIKPTECVINCIGYKAFMTTKDKLQGGEGFFVGYKYSEGPIGTANASDTSGNENKLVL